MNLIVPSIYFSLAWNRNALSFIVPRVLVVRRRNTKVNIVAGGSDCSTNLVGLTSYAALATDGPSIGDARVIARQTGILRGTQPDVLIASTPKGLLYGLMTVRIVGIFRRMAVSRRFAIPVGVRKIAVCDAERYTTDRFSLEKVVRRLGDLCRRLVGRDGGPL